MADEIFDDKELMHSFEVLGISREKLEEYFPRIAESLVPLSRTGVPSRTYIHWRKMGVIDHPSTLQNSKERILLNFYDFVWVKICVVLRDFGLPLHALAQARRIYMTNIFTEISSVEEPVLRDLLVKYTTFTPEVIEANMVMIRKIRDEYQYLPPEELVAGTLLAACLSRILLSDDQISLVITCINGHFSFEDISFKSLGEIKDNSEELLRTPHLHIPLRKFIEDFFDEPKNAKYIESFGLINSSERRVLEAIRNKTFKEIIIRFGKGGQDLIVEGFSDGDIMDSKAKEIQRILGMKDYSEVTLKFRNDQHIFFRNKTRVVK